MPRAKIDPFWLEPIRSATANNPRWGPGRVTKVLEVLAKEAGRVDWPSHRTIGRIQAEFRALPEQSQRSYLDFRWPDAMERCDIPWEATSVAIEALRYIRSESNALRPLLHEHRRPSVATIKWLWRFTLAVPDHPINHRLLWALVFAQSEGTDLNPRLAYEAMIVTGFEMEGESYFGETVRDPSLDLLTLYAEAAADRDVRDVIETLKEGEPWREEETAKAPSTSGATDDGAPRSASKAAGAKPSMARRERKSRRS